VDGYGPPARWDLIAEAKAFLKIPLVGNGDILNVAGALKMMSMTGCDALMIGRGSVINPFIFHEIQSHFRGEVYQPEWKDLLRYFEVYLAGISPEMPERNRVSKLKQLLGFLFKGSEALLKRRNEILTSSFPDQNSFVQFALPLLREGWEARFEAQT
jgi:tRNA-dihydrouridine synthase